MSGQPGRLGLKLLPDAFEINDQFHAARIFTQEFGDAVVGEGDFEGAFKTTPEFPPGVASFADVLDLHADFSSNTVQVQVTREEK